MTETHPWIDNDAEADLQEVIKRYKGKALTQHNPDGKLIVIGYHKFIGVQEHILTFLVQTKNPTYPYSLVEVRKIPSTWEETSISVFSSETPEKAVELIHSQGVRTKMLECLGYFPVLPVPNLELKKATETLLQKTGGSSAVGKDKEWEAILTGINNALLKNKKTPKITYETQFYLDLKDAHLLEYQIDTEKEPALLLEETESSDSPKRALYIFSQEQIRSILPYLRTFAETGKLSTSHVTLK